MARVAAENKLHIKPLLDYIESREGMAEFLYRVELVRGESQRLAVFTTIERAKVKGWISALVVDDLLVSMYGRLGHEVYHEEWWSPTYADEEAAEIAELAGERYVDDVLEEMVDTLKSYEHEMEYAAA